MTVWIGTSGWQYADWRERFYPRGLAQKGWLRRYSDAFATVEVNATFYRLPKPGVAENWARTVPEDFVLVLKASRYLTHIKRLRDPAEPVQRFMGVARAVGDKLGPVLLQLPPNLQADLDALHDTLGTFPSDVRLAVEPRHDSWFTEDCYAILRGRNAALCLADRKGSIVPEVATADWGYVRFHEGRGTPRPGYTARELDAWAARLAELWPSGEVFAFFNNDHRACAVRDAVVFADACRASGLRPTRTPPRTEVRVA